MAVELSDSGAATLSRNDELVLRLPENPTTGYRWEVTQSAAGTLRLIDDRFVAGGGLAPGAGGQRVIRFAALAPGNVQISAVMRRSWETSSPAETRGYSIVVK